MALQVKSTGCLCREAGVNSWHLQGGSQPSFTPVPENQMNALTYNSHLALGMRMVHIYTCAGRCQICALELTQQGGHRSESQSQDPWGPQALSEKCSQC